MNKREHLDPYLFAMIERMDLLVPAWEQQLVIDGKTIDWMNLDAKLEDQLRDDTYDAT